MLISVTKRAIIYKCINRKIKWWRIYESQYENGKYYNYFLKNQIKTFLSYYI